MRVTFSSAFFHCLCLAFYPCTSFFYTAPTNIQINSTVITNQSTHPQTTIITVQGTALSTSTVVTPATTTATTMVTSTTTMTSTMAPTVETTAMDTTATDAGPVPSPTDPGIPAPMSNNYIVQHYSQIWKEVAV